VADVAAAAEELSDIGGKENFRQIVHSASDAQKGRWPRAARTNAMGKVAGGGTQGKKIGEGVMGGLIQNIAAQKQNIVGLETRRSDGRRGGPGERAQGQGLCPVGGKKSGTV